ncbi:MAG: hypothetical protein LC772_01735 [Chloroflexi bacterium]|nr:hypothetical protein [Chloroflexota bacterium]
MAAKKLKPEDWAAYLALYREVDGRLRVLPWFVDGWETKIDYLNPEKPRGAWMDLIRADWFDGAIHLETWVNQGRLEIGTSPVVLHFETVKDKHGVNRNGLAAYLLERKGTEIREWEGYTVRADYSQEPVRTTVPCSRETLVESLEREFTRLHTLGAVIDEAIAAQRK